MELYNEIYLYGLITPAQSTCINEYNFAARRQQVAGFFQQSLLDITAAPVLWERIGTTSPTVSNTIKLNWNNPQYDSRALGINSIFPSHVVGWNQQTNNSLHKAVKWEKGPITTQLGTLALDGKSGSGEARDVNDKGDVVGWADNANGQKRAFLWVKNSQDGVAGNLQMHDLGTLGGNESEAFAINNLGQVVGTAMDANGNYHAFLWTPTPNAKNGVGTIQDLHLLGFQESAALDINDKGNVVGNLYNPSYQGFYWNAVTGTKQLSNLGYSAEAKGINNNDVIVGNSKLISTGESRAAIWSSGLNITDLNSLIPKDDYVYVLTDAADINSTGVIASTGYVGMQTDELRGILLLPLNLICICNINDGSTIIIPPESRTTQVSPSIPFEVTALTDSNLLIALGGISAYIRDKALREKVQQFFLKLKISKNKKKNKPSIRE